MQTHSRSEHPGLWMRPPPHGHSPNKVWAPLTNVAGASLIRRGEEAVLVKTEFL